MNSDLFSWAALIGTAAVGAVSIGTKITDDPPPIQSISGDVPFEVYQGDDDAGQQDQPGVVFESGGDYSGEVHWSGRDYKTWGGDDTWDGDSSWDGDDEPINSEGGVSQVAAETASDESISTEEEKKRPYYYLGRRYLRAHGVSEVPEASSESTWTEDDELRHGYYTMLYLDGDESVTDEFLAMADKRDRLVKEPDTSNGKSAGYEEPQGQPTPSRQGFLQAIDAAGDEDMIRRNEAIQNKAIQAANSVLEDFPNNAKAFSLRGRAYQDLGRHAEAIADLKRALSAGLPPRKAEQARQSIAKSEAVLGR